MEDQSSPWTEANIRTASEMWRDGKSASDIARRINCSRNAVLGKMHRLRALFPKREGGAAGASVPTRQSQTRAPRTTSFNIPAIRKARAAAVSAPEADPQPETVCRVSPWVDGAEHGARSDLSRFRLAGVAPKPFAGLGRMECRFPLVPFEAPSGPDMPCCGAATGPLKSYCDAHLSVMAGRDV